MNDAAVSVRGLVRTLGAGGTPTEVLRGIDLSVPRGEFLALTGASGSGKSTLLYLLGALDRPSAGEVWIDGVELALLDDDDRARLRSERLGFVFQFHFLLAEFTVLENVMIPLLRRDHGGVDHATELSFHALDLLGLADLTERLPSQLSGGQQQRVSIARAIAGDPALVLADEPTGNLDSVNAELVFSAFRDLVRSGERSVVMVTHDRGFASRADRRVVLRDGVIVDDVRNAGASPAAGRDAAKSEAQAPPRE